MNRNELTEPIRGAEIKMTVECCLCGKTIDRRMSCDPHPLRKRGRCCQRCDDLKVTPARLAAKGIPPEEAKVIGQNIHSAVKFHRRRMKRWTRGNV